MSQLIEFQKVLMYKGVRKKKLNEIRMLFEAQQKAKHPLERLTRCIRYFELPYTQDYFEMSEAELMQCAKALTDELMGVWKSEFEEKISPVKESLNKTLCLTFEKYRDTKIKAYLYQNQKKFEVEFYKIILINGINDLIEVGKITSPSQLSRLLGGGSIVDNNMQRYINGILIFLEGEAAKFYLKYENEMLNGNAKWMSSNYFYSIWAVNFVHQKFYKKSLELKQTS